MQTPLEVDGRASSVRVRQNLSDLHVCFGLFLFICPLYVCVILWRLIFAPLLDICNAYVWGKSLRVSLPTHIPLQGNTVLYWTCTRAKQLHPIQCVHPVHVASGCVSECHHCRLQSLRPLLVCVNLLTWMHVPVVTLFG